MNLIAVFRNFPDQQECIDYLEKVAMAGKTSLPFVRWVEGQA